MKNTEALVPLSNNLETSRKQLDEWDRIDGLTHDVQVAVIRCLDLDLTHLDSWSHRLKKTHVRWSEGAAAPMIVRAGPRRENAGHHLDGGLRD